MPKKNIRQFRLLEDVAAMPQSGLTVDRANNTVHNLLLSGLQSKNGRHYTPDAYSQALQMYEGARCNVDHPAPQEKEVPFHRRFGIYRNVRMTPQGPRADLVFNPAHPMAETFLWWAENCPEAVGLSHNADGEGQVAADGTVTVTKLHKIHSVDLVADPATSTRGLAESMPDPMTSPMTPNNPMTPLQPKAGMGQPQQQQGDSWQSKVADAIKSLMLDEMKSPEDKWASIEQLFNAVHPPSPDDGDYGQMKEDMPEDEGEEMPMNNGEKTAEEPDNKAAEPAKGKVEEAKMCEDDETMDDKTMESVRAVASKNPAVRKLLESYDRKAIREALAKKTADCKKACKMASLPDSLITDVFIESLVAVNDPRKRQTMIEDRRKIFLEATRVKPVSAAPGPVGNGEYQAFVAALKTAKPAN